MATMPAPDDRMLSVSEITNSIRTMLGDAFPGVWVKGEISGFRGPNNSGHAYFSVKDANATLGVVIFKGSYTKLTFVPRDGMEVEVFGNVDVYPPSGKYQLIVRQIRPAGIGALLMQLEELKRRLAAEGLFDTDRKQDLPRYPLTIGVVTSPIGAAVRDILKVLRGRWPGVRIVLAPVKVQGEGAAAEIAAAIERFDRWGGADVLIVGRGGGSIEDLWAFNEEVVVRAIAAARTPIISAVGHEVDTTLADFAADRRAATPSNAAEIAVRDSNAVRREIVDTVRRMGLSLRHRVRNLRAQLQSLLKQHGFRRVKDVFNTFRQRTDEFRQRLDEAIHDRLAHERDRLTRARGTYAFREALPRRLAEARTTLDRTRTALDDAIVTQVQDRRRAALALADRLRALSPRQVLERGYALVKGPDGRFVRSASTLTPGTTVTLEFASGEADATVTNLREGGTDGTQPKRRR